MKKYNLTFAFLIAVFSYSASFAQSGKLRAANKHFENLAYVQSIRLYEDVLKSDKSLAPEERMAAALKLGFAYRKVQDTRGAERVFRKAIEEFGSAAGSEAYLYYAQALANNGKYRESQRMYSKYGEMQAEDLRGRRFTVAYMDNSRFFKDSSTYKVQPVETINTRQSDFSPMYYQGGLVFCSARNESGGIRRIFEHNESPFLDLFLHPDTAQLAIPTKFKPQGGALGAGHDDDENPKLKNLNGGDIAEPKLSKVEQFSRTINTKYHEGPMTFFSDQKKIIFTRNNSNKGRGKESSDGVKKLKLYSAINNGRGWKNIEELPFNSNEYSTGHPALTPDNTKMYFVSDMPGGYGGTDVYVVEYNNGAWGAPVNMGKGINTEGNEMFPYCDANGNLYFASDGHEGLGGLDIFYVEMRENVPVGDVENLGAPINSEKDDFGMITDDVRSTGYFSSNRKRGFSDDNIYTFRRQCRELNLYVYNEDKAPLDSASVRLIRNGRNDEMLLTNGDGLLKMCIEPGVDYEFLVLKDGYAPSNLTYGTLSNRTETNVKIYLEKSKAPIVRGLVKSEADQQPIEGAKVILKNNDDGTTKEVITGRDGRYEFGTQINETYSVIAEKDNYAINEEVIGKVKSTKRGPSSINNDMPMYGQGDTFTLYNIYYDLNKYFIRPDAASELDARLVPLMRKYPQMVVEIRSHTDARASDLYNTRLSENRARAVVDYLIGKGIRSNRLMARGYGETELVNNCSNGTICAEEEHQKNRRTEFKILGLGTENVSIKLK